MDNRINIRVRIAYQYGTRRLYPEGRTGSIICALLGRKTLTEHVVLQLKALGYEFEITNQEKI